MKPFIYISSILLLLSGCSMQKQISGNVYKLLFSDSIHENRQADRIKGLRIDNIRNDTLFVKYKIGNEIFLDADFVYDHLKTHRDTYYAIDGFSL